MDEFIWVNPPEFETNVSNKICDIDNHYTCLNYEPIDFIEKFNLNFISGNFVKLLSRHNTTKRNDLDNKAKLERIRFYLERSIKCIDKPFFDAHGLREDLRMYIEANNFTTIQKYYFTAYFNAVINKDAQTILHLIEILEQSFGN